MEGHEPTNENHQVKCQDKSYTNTEYFWANLAHKEAEKLGRNDEELYDEFIETKAIDRK